MFFRRRFVESAIAAGAIVAGGYVMGITPAPASAAPAPPMPMPVAVEGQPAPFNGTYSFLESASLSGTGRVVFNTDVGGGATRRVIVSTATPTTPGTAQNVALSGAPSGVGGTFSSFFNPMQTRGGKLGFVGKFTNVEPYDAVYFGTVSAYSPVVISKSTAPTGNLFGPPQNHVFNDAGQIAFNAMTGYGSSTIVNGVFTGTAGSIQTVALQGTATPAPASFGPYESFSRPRINGSGVVIFEADTGPGYTGIFAGTPGAVQVVAFQNQPSPNGGLYATVSRAPAINDAGQIAFSSNLYNGPTSGIFLGPVGALRTVALRGGATPAGGTFGLLEEYVALNGAGKVAFKADVVGDATNEGIFLGDADSLIAVATQGGAAPGGGTFDGQFGTFGEPALNGVGQVAFTATLTGGTSSFALFGGTPGNLMRVVGTGDSVNVGGGFGSRTVSSISFFVGSGGQDGFPISLADNGTLLYRLRFTDGTSGFFVSAIPEPGTATLMVVAISTAWLRRRRRR